MFVPDPDAMRRLRAAKRPPGVEDDAGTDRGFASLSPQGAPAFAGVGAGRAAVAGGPAIETRPPHPGSSHSSAAQSAFGHQPHAAPSHAAAVAAAPTMKPPWLRDGDVTVPTSPAARVVASLVAGLKLSLPAAPDAEAVHRAGGPAVPAHDVPALAEAALLEAVRLAVHDAWQVAAETIDSRLDSAQLHHAYGAAESSVAAAAAGSGGLAGAGRASGSLEGDVSGAFLHRLGHHHHDDDEDIDVDGAEETDRRRAVAATARAVERVVEALMHRRPSFVRQLPSLVVRGDIRARGVAGVLWHEGVGRREWLRAEARAAAAVAPLDEEGHGVSLLPSGAPSVETHAHLPEAARRDPGFDQRWSSGLSACSSLDPAGRFSAAAAPPGAPSNSSSNRCASSGGGGGGGGGGGSSSSRSSSSSGVIDSRRFDGRGPIAAAGQGHRAGDEQRHTSRAAARSTVQAESRAAASIPSSRLAGVVEVDEPSVFDDSPAQSPNHQPAAAASSWGDATAETSAAPRRSHQPAWQPGAGSYTAPRPCTGQSNPAGLLDPATTPAAALIDDEPAF